MNSSLPDIDFQGIHPHGSPASRATGFEELACTLIEEAVCEWPDGIGSVSFPMLNPEFSNPLFLRLACEALATLGHDSFQLDSAGFTTVCHAFLRAVNERLSSRQRCDFDPERPLVQQAVRALAEAIETSESTTIDRETAERLLQNIHPSAEWSKSLLKGLISEGVLIKTPAGFGFGYQRLGDIARAALRCENTDEEIKQWADGLGRHRWRHRGVLGALAVMLPEARGEELIEILADDNGRVTRDEIELFVDSLVLRSAGSVSPKTLGIVRQLLGDEDLREPLFDQFVQLSCVLSHPLNADQFHAWLMEQGLAERDAQWSHFLVEQTEYQTSVERLINWARYQSGDAETEVRRLAGLMLGWMLATSDNRVRDRATKALVALFEPGPDAAEDVLRSFEGVNDPCVLERLAAAACGAVLRSPDTSAHHKLANGTADMLAAEWPSHLLTRDYAHRIFQLALSTGWIPPDRGGSDGQPYNGPPYGAELPTSVRTTDQIEAMTELPDYDYGSIWYSIHYGDFGRYILEPYFGRFEPDRQGGLVGLVERMVFDRVVELGWTWRSSPPVTYSHAEQLVYRDIDPTILAHKPDTGPLKPWFSPTQAAFDPKKIGKAPTDIDGLPTLSI
ncbi:MAG: hypothetical protein OXG34_15865 [bacterium]|nr:hypothetical protein [bacterium]